MPGPLSDVRILDLTSNFMGPYASLLLADMGADVCKIEPPEGDVVRNVGPARNKGMAAVFLHLNRNKRSIVLDLKSPAGNAALRKMIESADVLLFSLRPKAMARLGLSFEDVQRLNSRIIYCGAFGFGQDGPYADRPAYDNLIQAGVGLPMTQARKTNGPPSYVGSAIVDRLVGMATSNAILAALHHRDRTGEGQAVSVPMYETFAHFSMGDHMYGHTFVPPIGDWGYARMTASDRRPLPTADGYISIEVFTDRHWQRLFSALGHPELAQDPKYIDISSRAARMSELYAFLSAELQSKSTAEWVETLAAADIPVMPMYTPATALNDPHMEAVNFFPEIEHPTEGRIRSIGLPHDFSASPTSQRFPAPTLGGNTAEILADYGFSNDEIQTLSAPATAERLK